MRWRPIVELPAWVAASTEWPREFIALLPDGTRRAAAWQLGTILLGPFGSSVLPSRWPTHFMPIDEVPPPTEPQPGEA